MDQASILTRAEAPAASLEVQDLSLTIEGRAVLRDLSLRVERGEVVALLGRDGAGKTLCFQAIAGLAPHNAGRMRLGQWDVTEWPADERARKGLSYLPEEDCIFHGLTVAENIALALELNEGEAERSADLERLLAAFRLSALRDQPASTLSGGERRRCEVARAMAACPAILMLDEPFRGLDPLAVAEIRRLLLQLKGEGVGVLVSDYDLHDLYDVMDRAYVLHEGTLVFSGNRDALLSDPEVRRLYLGETFKL
ncbi:LPS export ABC transporter ATP-binding protein [Sphingomonas arenae]|uniref:LPS export ABC transporter ATP-binding protein n=1 Tax=Sphingomonas arenae TaxID=2812555 RepID=UPI001967B77F|nr:LPS export ABC transporter ATP-binding protein [Sphingomonas arenae]